MRGEKKDDAALQPEPGPVVSSCVNTIAMTRHATIDRAEASLVERARAGDVAAREAFVRTHADEVYRAVARILVGRSDAWEDVAQDAMLNVLKGLARFEPDGPASVRTWVLTVTVRTAIDALRRRARHATRIAALGELPRAEADSPEVLTERRELAARVGEAMQALPDEQRVALVLRAFHDLDYAEIASATQSSVANVKSRIHRAREALARVLGVGRSGGHE